MADDSVNLRKIFADICKGFTPIQHGGKFIYIKHLSHFDQVNIDLEREAFFQQARKRKIPTLEGKLQWLEQEGLWTKKDDSNLRQQKSYLDNLEKTKSQVLTLQRKQIEKTIQDTLVKYNEEFERKHKLIGFTCEQYADQKIQGQYLYQSFFCDKELKNRYFSEESFNDLEDEELNNYMISYLNFVSQFGHDHIKKLSVANFFTSYFYISEDISSFFGVPVSGLSFYQLNLLSYASYYKSIIQNNKIPETAREDPDKIEEYVKKSEGMKKTLDKAKKRDGGYVGIVGATKEDFEAVGMKDGGQSGLFKGEIKNINDAVKIYGD